MRVSLKIYHYLLIGAFLLGFILLAKLCYENPSWEVFFISALLIIQTAAIVVLLQREDLIKSPILNASRLIGLSNHTDNIINIVSDFAEEFTRYHRTINALHGDGHSSSADLGTKLRKLAKLIYVELKANAVELALFDDESQQWSQAMVIGAPHSRDTQAMFAEIQESKTKKIILKEKFQTVAMPLLMGGTVFGVIRVEIPSTKRPSKNDIELLNLFSLQGALAIVDARYTDELIRLKKASDETLKAKTGFLANLSHEIRGPLGTVLNAIELLRDGLCGEMNEEQLSMLTMVKNSGDHLLDLVNDVLDYAKIEAGKVQPQITDINVNELLADITTSLTPQAHDKKHELILKEVDSSLIMKCDRRHARQILINLLTNAIKYTPDGGKIEVSAERNPDGGIKVLVKDSGVGIPEDQKEKVFTAFERVDDKYSIAQVGAGLGMPLSLRLAQISGGTIEFSSKVGEGSIFWLIMPESEMTAETLAKLDSEVEIQNKDRNGHGELILIIDHDPSAQTILSKYLSNQGFHIMQAENKEQVENIIGEKEFHLAIVENDLPDLPGEHVLNSIRNNPATAKIPIILLSAKAFVFDIERFIKIGADRCLSKPFQLDEIAVTIRQLLDTAK